MNLITKVNILVEEILRHLIRHMTGTDEHSVSIIEFDLELHARNYSIAY